MTQRGDRPSQICSPFGLQVLLMAVLIRLMLPLACLFPCAGAAELKFGGAVPTGQTNGSAPTVVRLDGRAVGKRFDGIGAVNGGGATSVLLKDYPEPQRSQILDLVYKPMFSASVSALFVEIPGDGNSTQSTSPSHMRTRDDLDYHRGWTWWILREAKQRNPDLSLDGTGWSAPGWIGNGNFWSQDGANYYASWLEGLRRVHGLEFDAIGCRNERGVSYDFVKRLRATLNAKGFAQVKIHGFDNWTDSKLDFVKDLLTDDQLRQALDIVSAHTFSLRPAKPELRAIAERLDKPIWCTEDHVYLPGFDATIGIVKVFNTNFIRNGATKTVNWYDIAGLYPLEPFSELPSMMIAQSPWSGHYRVREALWGYAHYGQFTRIGWTYVPGGCGDLKPGGSFVTLKSPQTDYSIIIETKDAKTVQRLRFELGDGLSPGKLCVWRSNRTEQFIRQPDLTPQGLAFELSVDPDSIYSLSTTTGQQKGSFEGIPAPKRFPFPYHETYDGYGDSRCWGGAPRYHVDFAGVFALCARPDGQGRCLRQVVPVPTQSWATEYHPYYTLLGDDQWGDYAVTADVLLNPGDTAGVMGRVNDVGDANFAAPKGYILTLGDDGLCRLIVSRGQKGRKQKTIFDPLDPVEERMQREKEDGKGGEKELASIRLPNIAPGQWHRLKLQMEKRSITALVDGRPVLTATDALYARGMAGLLAGQHEKQTCSTPYFDDLVISEVDVPVPPPTPALDGQTPLYRLAAP